MLLAGGTAVDAAVAAGATLAVVYPHMTGLGGDSFWLIWDERARRLHGLEACGRAAAQATPALYRSRGLTAIPARGPLAALTVPGAVDGLWEAHRLSRETLGSPVAWGDLLEDAIRHARDGVAIPPSLPRVTARAEDLLAGDDTALQPWRAAYLPAGTVPEPGALLIQPRLARTLARLAASGGRAFYEGELGAEIATACEALGSPLRAADLETHRSRWVEPLRAPYRGRVAVSMPPPSQGMSALAVLGLLDTLDLRAAARDPALYVHIVVEATKLAFADRDRWLADPEVAPVPVARLLDPAYLRTRAEGIDPGRSAAVPATAGVSGGDTIACVTADAAGNAVSLIQSLYHEWGAGVLAGETGIVLQNRGAFFSLDPGDRNALAPGKRPFHTLTPFMLLDGGRPSLVAGTMGGEGQPQTLVAVATRVLDLGWELQAAVEGPRWLHGRTWGAPSRALSLEARFGEDVVDRLRARGHPVQVVEAWSDRMGHAQAIALDRASGSLVAAGDPRADGPPLAA
jgi:oxamate amidohydrolase